MKTRICDDSSVEHRYEIVPHTTTQGIRLGIRLLAVLGPAAGRFLGETLGGASAQQATKAAVEAEPDDNEQAKKTGLDADISPETIAKIADSLVERLVAADCPGLVREVLANVTRDDKPLDNPANFETAYQANYGELAEALAWAIRQNGFHRFLLRGLSKAMAAQ